MKRDKFLTEAMGEKLYWLPTYEDSSGDRMTILRSFDTYEAASAYSSKMKSGDAEQRRPHNFSTWQGFGKLWEWAQKQEWWSRFVEDTTGIGDSSLIDVDCIDPDRFADALYEFLNTLEED